MRYLEVTWDDAHGGGNVWAPIEQVRAARARRIVSVGQVVDDTAAGVTLVLSHDTETDGCDAYLFIPARSIVGRRELKPGRATK